MSQTELGVVEGCGVGNEHRFDANDESVSLVVGVDRGYLASRLNLMWRARPCCVHMTVLKNILRSCRAKMGVDILWYCRACAFMLSRAGFASVVRGGDTEPAVVALQTATGRRLSGQFGTHVLPQDNSVGGSADNGVAEHSMREIQAKARFFARAVSVMLKVILNHNHFVVAWSAHWAAVTIIARRGPHGRTACQRRFGHAFKRPIAEFGKKMLYSRLGNVTADCLRGCCSVCFLVQHCN